MEIVEINIKRSEYGANKGQFESKIVMKGESIFKPSVTLAIPDEMLEPIVGIIHQATVASMQRATQEFEATLAATLAGKVIDAKAIEAPVEDDDEIVF